MTPSLRMLMWLSAMTMAIHFREAPSSTEMVALAASQAACLFAGMVEVGAMETGMQPEHGKVRLLAQICAVTGAFAYLITVTIISF